MKHKCDVHDIFLAFQKLVENLFDYTIKGFQSDGGKESDDDPLKAHFLHCNLYFRKSCPDTPKQNGLVGWKHHQIIEVATLFFLMPIFLLNSGLMWLQWALILLIAFPHISQIITLLLKNYFHKVSNYFFLCVFRCDVNVFQPFSLSKII